MRCAMKSSFFGLPASSNWPSHGSRRKSPGGFISFSENCSTGAADAGQGRKRLHRAISLASRRDPDFFQFGSGSAGIATAIRSSRAGHAPHACGRRDWRACTAIEPACSIWSEISASRIMRSHFPIRFAMPCAQRSARLQTGRPARSGNRGEIFRPVPKLHARRIEVTTQPRERKGAGAG